MDNCGICLKPADQLFETGKDGVYACFKCQPLVPEVTLDDNEHQVEQVEVEIANSDDDEESPDTSLYCGICHKSFQKNMQLQNHLRNHRAERRFVCTYCNKGFSQSNNLRAHLRIHTNERPYKCGECGKAFTQVTNLNNHVRLHTGERPFVCPEPGCNKAYAQVTNLNQHRKRHLNGRPVEATYDCSICGEQFQQRNHMYTHRRDVHAEMFKGLPRAAGRRHVCSLCDATLPTERQLRDHVATHVATTQIATADVATAQVATTQVATAPASDSADSGGEGGSYSCVFRVCGARFSSPREHTEHLLRAHQLHVLAARPPQPPRRGRPPKTIDQDPLEISDSEIQEIKVVKEERLQFVPKLKVQSLFQ